LVFDQNKRIPVTAMYLKINPKLLFYKTTGVYNKEKLTLILLILEKHCTTTSGSNVQTPNSIGIIEGGRQTLQTFIDVNLWDEARVFSGNIFLPKV
jgi:diaminohydroxyphosphoribosylaminopyrimidine deaminase/5-amino-6-(5-phosphoribosylamino)uracil reductase